MIMLRNMFFYDLKYHASELYVCMFMFMGLFARMFGVSNILFAGRRVGDVTNSFFKPMGTAKINTLMSFKEGTCHHGWLIHHIYFISTHTCICNPFRFNWIQDPFKWLIETMMPNLFAMVNLGFFMVLYFEWM